MLQENCVVGEPPLFAFWNTNIIFREIQLILDIRKLTLNTGFLLFFECSEGDESITIFTAKSVNPCFR